MSEARNVYEREDLEHGYDEWRQENEADSANALDRTDGLRAWVAGRQARMVEQQPAPPQPSTIADEIFEWGDP
jgi:hypothetical protein